MKYLVLTASCIILSGCFLTHEEVQLMVKACEESGGKNTIHINRDSRAMSVTCNIGGVVYKVTADGKLI